MPSAFDAEIIATARSWGDGAPADREAWEAAAQPRHAELWRTFARRMAVVAVRERSERHVLLGIVGLAIEGFRCEPRASQAILALLCHSAELIEVGAEGPVRSVARLAAPVVEEQLLAFVARPPERRSIGALGFEEWEGPEGFTYRQTW